PFHCVSPLTELVIGKAYTPSLVSRKRVSHSASALLKCLPGRSRGLHQVPTRKAHRRRVVVASTFARSELVLQHGTGTHHDAVIGSPRPWRPVAHRAAYAS